MYTVGPEAPAVGDQSHHGIPAGDLASPTRDGGHGASVHGDGGHFGIHAGAVKNRGTMHADCVAVTPWTGLEGSDRLAAWRANVGEPVALDLAPPATPDGRD